MYIINVKCDYPNCNKTITLKELCHAGTWHVLEGMTTTLHLCPTCKQAVETSKDPAMKKKFKVQTNE